MFLIELRQSRQSLAGASDRMSRSSYPPSHLTAATATVGSNAGGGGGRRTRPRSRTREHRPGSRYSTAGSTHTLNNYCDTSDNWTDHDMDIYMARNPTTRGGLVPLWSEEKRTSDKNDTTPTNSKSKLKKDAKKNVAKLVVELSVTVERDEHKEEDILY